VEHPLLSVAGLCKSFGGLAAVRDVGFTVGDGEILGIIGPNGSGKTTVFNLITGFLLPDAGSVRLAGDAIGGLKPHMVARKGVARTFQLVRPFRHLSALDNVMIGSLFGRARTGHHAAERDAREVLAVVGLADHGGTTARALTLPNRKRLELARALAARPRLLLLDEYMAGLNASEVDAAMAMLRRVRDGGVAIVMIEHIVRAVMRLSDRIVVMNAGRVIAQGTPDAVRRDPLVIEAYLGAAHA
jgi:branched-chain amino acid transport system ATP-binding protein